MDHKHESLVIDELSEQPEVPRDRPLLHLLHETSPFKPFFGANIFLILFIFLLFSQVRIEDTLGYCHSDIVAPINADLVDFNPLLLKVIIQYSGLHEIVFVICRNFVAIATSLN